MSSTAISCIDWSGLRKNVYRPSERPNAGLISISMNIIGLIMVAVTGSRRICASIRGLASKRAIPVGVSPELAPEE
ncbi:hypothetical protein D3C87_1886770 [compost metagenome]